MLAVTAQARNKIYEQSCTQSVGTQRYIKSHIIKLKQDLWLRWPPRCAALFAASRMCLSVTMFWPWHLIIILLLLCHILPFCVANKF